MALRSLVRVALVLAVVGVHLVAATAPSSAATTQKRLAKQTVLKKGLKWLESQQAEDGSYLDPRGSPESATALVVSSLIALRNAGVDVELDAAVAYLQQTDPTRLEGSPGGYLGLAAIVIALVAAGGDPHNVAAVDLVARLVDSWDADAGLYGTYLIESAVVVMALAVAGEPYEEQAIETIVAKQVDDGSWALDGNTVSGDAFTTAYVVQMLVAIAYDDDEVVANAIAYFHTVQAGETVAFGVGAFRPTADSAPDANTTGLVLSALIAAGENPKAQEWGKAVDGLLTFQNENGVFRFNDLQPIEDIYSTTAALTALAGAYWPVLPTTA